MSKHTPQKYLGNNSHSWEFVCYSDDAIDEEEALAFTERLRVPGGWLYRDLGMIVFVPMPIVVKHKV